MEKNYYMIRMTNATEQEYELSFRENFVAIGWSEVVLSGYVQDEEAASAAVCEEYYKNEKVAPQTIGRKLNAVRRFLRIKENDIIILPYNSGIRIAVAEKEHYYDEKLRGMDLANCVRVRFLRAGDNQSPLTIARKQLTERFQRRLRVRGSTVSDLYEFGEEIEQIMSEKDYAYDHVFMRDEEKLISEFKSQLLSNIRKGNTHLQTGGIGLENLIVELLECDGYKARRYATTATKGIGDVDVEAVKANRFGEERIRIQSKHHDGISGAWGVEQLRAADAYYNDPDCVYVWLTSGEPSEEARKQAEDANVLVIDGNELAEWIYECLDKLSKQTLCALGISQVPQIISKSASNLSVHIE